MKTKKLIGAIIVFAAIMLISIFSNSVQADSLGYVTITTDRTVDNVVYRHQLYSLNTSDTKNIWNLVSCTQTGVITDTISDLYCLRAGLGFTSSDPSNTVVEYSQSYNMIDDYQSLVTYFSGVTSETTLFKTGNEEKFYSVMWILDNMLLEDATDEDLTEYLKTAAGYTATVLNDADQADAVLSRADIEAIQQLAIWYFTNSDESAYNSTTLPTIYMSVDGDSYEDYADRYNGYDAYARLTTYGTQRQAYAEALYDYLITNAAAAASGTYTPSRTITVYLAGTGAATEQPIVRVEESTDEADISLRKFISAVNGAELSVSREPVVDTSSLNKYVNNVEQTTAIYSHSKTAVSVEIGDIVTYTIRLYNEGDIDAYITEVTDYLPEYLEYVAYGSDSSGAFWELTDNEGRIAVSTDYCTVIAVGGNTDTSGVGQALSTVLIPATEYNDTTDDYTLSYVDIQISCKVLTTTPYETALTNIAEVTGMTDSSGDALEDRDSEASSGMTLPSDSNLSDYTGGANGKNDPYYDGTNVVSNTNGDYYPGQEDDDDFDKVIVETPEIDLALRKFISAVGTTTYDRAPTVVTNTIATTGTATYNHSKVPVEVSIGDIVTYTIRLYNEGDVDGVVTEVTDYLATNLKYVAYGNDDGTWWTYVEGNEYNTATTNANCIVVAVGGNTDTSGVGKTLGEVVIPAYDKASDVLSYVDIEIHCEVLESDDDAVLTNIAEITKMEDKYGNEIDEDKDSIPDDVVLPSDFPGYKDDEIGTKDYIPGQEDDDDFEKVIVDVPEVDLALRKFISAVGTTTYDRAPTVYTDTIATTGTATYNHSKVPVEVEIGDVVTYTIRIYNEGEIDGIVTEVTDYLATNLKYVTYGNDDGTWWTYVEGSEYNTATTNANCIVVAVGGNTDTSSVGKTLSEVVIPAYDETNDVLSYIDIEIHCQVMKVEETTKLTNIAEITEMTDTNGNIINEDKDSTPDDVVLPSDFPGYKDDEIGQKPYIPGQEDDDDFEKVIVKIEEVDLSLRKFISEVDGTALATSREPVVDTTPLDYYTDTTAEYNHSKTVVSVERGSLVTYTIRVYNEGEADGYVSEITDYLPGYLTYVEDNAINKLYGWTYDETTREVTTTITAKDNTAGDTVYASRLNGKLLVGYDGNGELDYIDVLIVCQVSDEAAGDTILTNLAQITEMTDEDGNILTEDIDSVPDGNFDLPSDTDRPTYKDNETGSYVPGQEDDDDFEKVIVVIPEFDLSLRKFISEVDGTALATSREPVVDTTPLDDDTDTTAEYNHSKTVVSVERGSLVTYTIRVYNEGEADGYVSEITDYLPGYLTYVEDNAINKLYGWTYDETTREVTTTITAKDNTAGDTVYASRTNGKLLLAYDGNGELDYIDVLIVCQVSTEVAGNTILTNLAQITEMTDEDGNILPEDIDSVPDGNFDLPSDDDRPTYKDNETGNYVPGQEDDDDFEKVQVEPDFDLALRKFITQVDGTSVNNRYPSVSYENSELVYTHTKDPVEVETGSVVVYTIRVYNEGEKDGYAEEITDDMPDGLEFLPDNEINVEYGWVMLDENQNETDDVSKAKYIITDYLSEAQEQATGRDNLIKAFDSSEEISDSNPDYRDVKIAFKVTYVATTTDEAARTIVNTAQISKDSDDDIDSDPNRDEEYDDDPEDDIDYDQVKVKYFDLSLLKWVAQTQVTLDGETVTTDTGHTAETAKNEDAVKIEVKSSDVDSIVIKYVYTIRITNEGEIAGYATEITDYIPEGLEFIADDNPDWYVISEGVVGTAALGNTLLEPGEYAEVQIILTWINGTENFGEKINLAEISKDDNPSDSPDIDSTPNNKEPDEDDIDDAPVILAVKTGEAQTYIGLTFIILTTLAGGISLIKQYVLI